MKRIGIVGGLGPEPTIEYYRIITEFFHGRPEGYPRIAIYSMDVNELRELFERDERETILTVLMEGINAVRRAGADFALIAANTPHIFYEELARRSPLPLVSIVEETLKAVRKRNSRRVGLLGTSFTMRSDLYQRVFEPAGIEVFVPNGEDQEYVQTVIYRELSVGRFLDKTREGLLSVVKRMIDDRSIEGLILGCTELPLILPNDHFGIPFFNTTRVHAESAVALCMEP